VSRIPATTLVRLAPDRAAAELAAEAGPEWTRRFLDALEREVRTAPLERLCATWDLSGAAAARLFGVSRQAFAKWLESGPPPERSAAVADLDAATELLVRHVKRERIPAVVRRPASRLQGRSLLELAQQGRTAEVRDAVREMFDLRRVQP
jgi:hypothetical protein